MRNSMAALLTATCLASAAVVPLRAGQHQNQRADSMGSPLASPVALAPFSAEATTTVRQALRDGTRVDQAATARYYRDSAGRVRVEQTIGTANGQSQTVILVAPDPTERMVYTLEPATRTFYLQPRSTAAILFNGLNTFALPVATNHFLIFHPQDWRTQGFQRPVAFSSSEESLGTRMIAGVSAEGRRITLTVGAGESDSRQPVDILADQWDSPELKLLVYSRYSNPETGFFEYRLTNISRDEPSPELFTVPADYMERTTTSADPAMTFDPWPRTERARNAAAQAR
jgi:hypothetical protein